MGAGLSGDDSYPTETGLLDDSNSVFRQSQIPGSQTHQIAQKNGRTLSLLSLSIELPFNRKHDNRVRDMQKARERKFAYP